MTLQLGGREENVILSFNEWLGLHFEAVGNFSGAYLGRCFYQDPLGDPTAMDAREDPLDYWIHHRYVSGGVGMKLPTIMQSNVYYRTGHDEEGDQATADRFGTKTSAIVTDMISAWRPANIGKPIYDFSTPATPTKTADWFLIKNSRGQQGWPDSRRFIPNMKGLVAEIVTWHVWHAQDLISGGAQLYF